VGNRNLMPSSKRTKAEDRCTLVDWGLLNNWLAHYEKRSGLKFYAHADGHPRQKDIGQKIRERVSGGVGRGMSSGSKTEE